MWYDLRACEEGVWSVILAVVLKVIGNADDRPPFQRIMSSSIHVSPVDACLLVPGTPYCPELGVPELSHGGDDGVHPDLGAARVDQPAALRLHLSQQWRGIRSCQQRGQAGAWVRARLGSPAMAMHGEYQHVWGVPSMHGEARRAV